MCCGILDGKECGGNQVFFENWDWGVLEFDLVMVVYWQVLVEFFEVIFQKILCFSREFV